MEDTEAWKEKIESNKQTNKERIYLSHPPAQNIFSAEWLIPASQSIHLKNSNPKLYKLAQGAMV